MKNRIIALVLLFVFVCGMAACAAKPSEEAVSADTEEEIAEEVVEETFTEEEGVFGEQAELTLFANGGTIWMGSEDPYDVELSAAAMDPGVTFAEAIGEEIASVEKDGAAFGGWTVYAVTEGEWVDKEPADLTQEQLCVPCGDYGFYVMTTYEVISEAAATEELLAMECDGRNYYALANWA